MNKGWILENLYDDMRYGFELGITGSVYTDAETFRSLLQETLDGLPQRYNSISPLLSVEQLKNMIPWECEHLASDPEDGSHFWYTCLEINNQVTVPQVSAVSVFPSQ